MLQAREGEGRRKNTGELIYGSSVTKKLDRGWAFIQVTREENKVQMIFEQYVTIYFGFQVQCICISFIDNW